jgi:HSP20 family protein
MAKKNKDKETKTVTPWRPFMDLARWERDMMEDFFGRRMRPLWPARFFGSGEMEFIAPTIDVYEEKDNLVVKAELPGIDKDNIKLNLTDHTLTIKGEKKKEEEVNRENYYRSERSYGSFVRTVELPTDVHADRVKASFKNGVLEVRMPKTEQAKAKEIKVNVE